MFKSFVHMLACYVAAGIVSTAANAQSGSVIVDAKSNIFGYGSGIPAPGGGGGGVLAPVISLSAGSGRTATFAGTGQAGWGGFLVNGPDGGTFSSNTNIPAVGPISGFAAPLSGELVGVFIEAGNISALVPPGAMSYPSVAAFSLATYAPGLRQVFYVGDGKTGTGAGATQVFHVPDGAAYLVLGIADAYAFNAPAGYYADNVGGYTVEYSISGCPGDLNHDGQVDDADFPIFVVGYNILDCADPTMPAGCPADLNRDGVVDDVDFQKFVVAYDALVCP